MSVGAQMDSQSWQQLLRAYFLCIEREGAFAEFLPRASSKKRYCFPPLARESVICGIDSTLAIASGPSALASVAQSRGEALYYGYPVVLFHESVTGPSGRTQIRRRLAPLLLVEMGLPPIGQPIGRELAPLTDVPTLHPQVLATLGYKAEQLVSLLETFPMEPQLGSHDGMRDYLRELIEELQLEKAEDIDPRELSTSDEGAIDGVGAHNVTILFRAKSAAYNARLLQELAELQSRWGEASSTAASLLGAHSKIATAGESISATVAPIPINESQETALRSAMSNRLTVVTGPPGTGKSQLVTNVIASCWVAGQSVLIASTNNQAVDVACRRAQEIWPGLIIRTGSREHREKAKELLGLLAQRREQWGDPESAVALVGSSWKKVQQLRDLMQHRSEVEGKLAGLALSREGLAEALGWDLKHLPQGIAGKSLFPQLRRAERINRARFMKRWRQHRFFRSLSLDEPLWDFALLIRFLRQEKDWRVLVDEERRLQSIRELWDQLLEAETKHRRVSSDAVKTIAGSSVSGGVSSIRTFNAARYQWGIESGPAAEFPKLLPHVKAWATTSLSTAATFPLRPALFDLLVVDEASQCSIAAILPLMFRAKRALIIGDPNQLQHIATISRRDEEACFQRAGLSKDWVENNQFSHIRHSAYLATARVVEQVHLLDEHYRSHPQIIEFSNRMFYGRALTVLTEPAGLLDFGTQAVAWRHVSGPAWRPEAGSALNEEEADAVVEELSRLIEKTPPGMTIGIVSPFSAQKRLIGQLAEKQVAKADRARVELAIGTAHTFQGDERDIVIFSPVVSDGIKESTLRWLIGTPNLFNVAVTRARSYLLVVGNQEYCSAMGGPLGELASYARDLQVERAVAEEGATGNLHSEAEARLYEALLQEGLTVKPKKMVHGYECDFVTGDEHLAVNIECDGVQHLDYLGRQRRQDLARDALLKASGLNVVRVPAWKCISDPTTVAIEIKTTVLALGPSPGPAATAPPPPPPPP